MLGAFSFHKRCQIIFSAGYQLRPHRSSSLFFFFYSARSFFEKVGCPAARHPSWELTLRIKDVVLNLEAVLPTEAAFAGLSVQFSPGQPTENTLYLREVHLGT